MKPETDITDEGLGLLVQANAYNMAREPKPKQHIPDMPPVVFSFDNIPAVPFRLHQSYEKPGSVMQIKCDKCGADRLEVGCGDYFTVIRCPKCKHERCIHDG